MTLKKFTFKSFAVIAMASFLTVSCSSDNKPAPDYASQIAKTYIGSVELSMSGSAIDDYMGMGKTLSITKVTNDSISAVLTIDYGTGSMSVESVTAGAKVTQVGDNYILTGGETVTGNIKATLTGQIGENGIDVTIHFTPGAMPVPITAKFSSKTATRTVTVDASDYMKWAYFSFEDGLVATYTVQLDGSGDATGAVVDGNGTVVSENSFDWDIALHREDIRTNNGGAINTEKKQMNEVTDVPTSGYTADTEGEVIIDLSDMMIGGTIKYAPSMLNGVLAGWLTKDLSQMPPVYTIHGWIYVVRTKEGKYAKIQFTDRTNDANVSGHITFTYEYPVE